VANATAYKRRMLLENAVESNALQRLMTFFEGTVAKMCENEGKCACLVVKLASEVADMSEPMREVLAAGQRDWILLVEQVLREGVQSGHIRATVAADQLAVTIWDLWGGAQQRALIQRNVAPLRHAIDFIRQQLSP
jgi:TetR/AcrR family transcriptional repressor of nem operon